MSSASVREFALSDIASFSWDRVFLFGEYTPAESIQTATRLHFSESLCLFCGFMDHVPEGMTLILFASAPDESPVCYELISTPLIKAAGDFSFDEASYRRSGLKRDEAHLRIIDSDRARELQLVTSPSG
jgi:hypothetical protein